MTLNRFYSEYRDAASLTVMMLDGEIAGTNEAVSVNGRYIAMAWREDA